MENYACFIKTDTGMLPVGYYKGKALAIGNLILALEDELAMTGEDVVFSSELYPYGATFDYGFCIDGTATDDNGETVKMTGYALIMEAGDK